jgi:hypothetical protein
MDRLTHAIYSTIHKTKERCGELAEHLAISYQVLSNKACETNEASQLNLLQTISVTNITKDYQIVEALCERVGGRFVRGEAEAHESLITGVLKTVSEHGDVSKTIQESMADGIYTDREKNKTYDEITEAIEALEQLRSTVRQTPTRIGG